MNRLVLALTVLTDFSKHTFSFRDGNISRRQGRLDLWIFEKCIRTFFLNQLKETVKSVTLHARQAKSEVLWSAT
jgi:hypothetical protein